MSLHVIKKIVDVDGRFSTSNNEDLGNFRNEFISVHMVIYYPYVFNISTVRCLKLHKCKMRTCRTCEWGKRTMLIILYAYAAYVCTEYTHTRTKTNAVYELNTPVFNLFDN